MSDLKYVLSLDVGTTGIRAVVLDQHTKVHGSSYVKTIPIYPHPGWIEMDPEILWSQCKQVITDAIKASKVPAAQISCLGITTQRNSFTNWNRDTGKPLHNFITWQDLRAAKLCREWNSSFSMKSVTTGAKLAHTFTRASRMKAASSFTFTTVQVSIRLAWIFQNIPEALPMAKAGKLMFGTVDTWLLYKFSAGALHATDYSNMSSTGLFDPFQMGWNDFVINMLSIPRSIFPEIRDTSGTFGSTEASLFGAPIPITAVVADQQSALFGECCFKRGDVKVTIGTGMMMDINTGSKPHASDKGLYPLVAWKIGDEVVFLAEAVASSAGSMIEWGQRFGLYQEPGQTQAMAESVPDSDGVYLVPGFNGLQAPYNDPNARAAFMGLTFGSTKEHCVRALLEAIAYQFKQLFDILKTDVPIRLNSVRMDGGVCRNAFLLQLCSTLTQTPLDIAETLDMTALGSAFLAGLAAGIWTSRDELSALRKSQRVFQPQPLSQAVRDTFRFWERTVQRCLSFDLKGSYFHDPANDKPGAALDRQESLRSMHAPKASTSGAASASKPHTKAREETYQGGVKRAAVSDSVVSWSADFPNYSPTDYTAPVVLSKPAWADVDVRTEKADLKFNAVDGAVDRTSFEGTYQIVDGLPRNPKGRTGLAGRGLLGRWGPNHAADPVVTRWQRDESGKQILVDGKPVLEFVAIKRKDNGQWAIPGGMVEPGDTVSATLKKEFGEEAMNSVEASEERKKELETQIDQLFGNGVTVFKGYVDDPRNTDNAWMETVAVNFHDDTTVFEAFKLQAGDDAGAVKWVAIDQSLALYASHVDFVQAAAKLHNAHW
ncbi:Gk5 protein [Capsaspora owczarzaki ATCC 30864]|uniref:Glycerol kinase 5 n=1 Tax=Capsaspora owczarzaki (strain ATCC 30864) TaxID=595528 RepID=A0A0D2VJK4_CAPO3|nr:Gk5 protein [Capsaspora owczarzaki ATCC 30864]KJE90147.1 Gk5 protein [Capsaspora owczarzaki ATCC 30864]|eukprot:XP_004364363.2 Gk5 protein [Capsaspora owczarzaki ATCC 30864]